MQDNSRLLLPDEEFKKYLENELSSLLENPDTAENNEIEEEKEDTDKDEAVAAIIPSYLKAIGQYPLFSREEEIAYGKMLKGNDSERLVAEDAFITHNLRLVVNIAKKYYLGGIAMEDLIQEGTIGLIKATKHYDVDRGCRFSTYASWWIRQSIQRSIYDTGRAIRLPSHIQEKMTRYKKLKRQSKQEGKELSRKEMAQLLSMTESSVKLLEEYELDVASLNLKVGEEEEMELIDMIRSPEKDLEEMYLDKEKEEIVEKLLTCLTEREREVIKARFGINVDGPKTLEEIAKGYSITRERVRQIEGNALKKLKHPARLKLIGSYSF